MIDISPTDLDITIYSDDECAAEFVVGLINGKVNLLRWVPEWVYVIGRSLQAGEQRRREPTSIYSTDSRPWERYPYRDDAAVRSL